jgi:hypothetical protein
MIIHQMMMMMAALLVVQGRRRRRARCWASAGCGGGRRAWVMIKCIWWQRCNEGTDSCVGDKS